MRTATILSVALLTASAVLAFTVYQASNPGEVLQPAQDSSGHSGALALTTQAALRSTGLRVQQAGDGLALRTVGYGDTLLPAVDPVQGGCAVGEPQTDGCLRQMELNHGPLTEWWVNRPAGLEQGWTLTEPPSEGPVSLRVAITEGRVLSVDADGLGATLASANGNPWRYGGLVAWDANHQPVTVRLAAQQDDLLVHVDTTGVTWPVTVDPILTDMTKLIADDGEAYDFYGFSVSGAGDVNGDGFMDVVVGAYGDDDKGTDSGAAYLYWGKSRCIDPNPIKLVAPEGTDLDWFGRAVSAAGDVNGDGFDDIVIGAHGDDKKGDQSGAAYVYLGNATWDPIPTPIKLVATDGGERDSFGLAVSGAGDVNGDGIDDLIIGSRADDDKGVNSGSAYLYLGTEGTWDPIPPHIKLVPSDGQAGDRFGGSVSGAGDVNNDGYDDIVVGAFEDDDKGLDSGSAYLYLGTETWEPAPSYTTKLLLSDGAANDQFGMLTSGAGDLNGDGFDDLVIGAFLGDATPEMGTAYVYFGTAGGLASEPTVLAPAEGSGIDEFGFSVSGAGDVNNDGFDDLVIGGSHDDITGTNSGSAYVYLGSATGLDPEPIQLLPGDGEAHDRFGNSVSGTGDIDGDGFDDLVIGAKYNDDKGDSSGSAYVYYMSYTADCTTEVCEGGLDEDCDGLIDALDPDCAVDLDLDDEGGCVAMGPLQPGFALVLVGLVAGLRRRRVAAAAS